MISVRNRGNVMLYACGGTGVNIAKFFEQYRDVEEEGLAKLQVTYIDTSRSNMHDLPDHPDVVDKHIFMIEGRDGSGKLRRENASEITERVRSILNTHKPQDLNIVLSSAGGGTGSTAGASLVSELIDRNIPTVVIIVGSVSSRLDMTNTLNTLKTYEAIVQKRSAPIVLSYFENIPGQSIKDIDSQVHMLIVGLTTLFSRQNDGLDTQDLVNWLRYDRVTSFKPAIAHLTIQDRGSEVVSTPTEGDVVAVASVARNMEETMLGTVPDYHTVGMLHEGVNEKILDRIPIHFVLRNGYIQNIANHFAARLKEFEDKEGARLKNSSMLSPDDKIEDNGLVL